LGHFLIGGHKQLNVGGGGGMRFERFTLFLKGGGQTSIAIAPFDHYWVRL
jgi:hypothetical protein